MTNRREEARRIIVDGATGYVGANLVAALVRDGRKVLVLSRRSVEETRHVIGSSVVLLGQAVDTDSIQVVPYSLYSDELGIGHEDLLRIFSMPCDYWHVAANVNFRSGNRNEIMAVNVGGTESSLRVFERHAPPGSRFLFASTAYCCGDQVHQPSENWYEDAPPSSFRNFYEYSKRRAELMVRDALGRGVTGAVLRLGQVVGDSRSGESTTDYGMYNLIRAVWAVARRRPGAHVRIAGNVHANLHLIPIDAAVRWMLAIAESQQAFEGVPVFHVVDAEPVSARSLLESLCRTLPLQVEIAPPEDFERRPSTQLERVIAARMAYTGNYLSEPFTFGRQRLDSLLVDEGPAITPEILDRIVESFVRQLRAGDSQPDSPARLDRESPLG